MRLDNIKRPIYSQKHYEDMAFDIKNGIYEMEGQIFLVKFLISMFKPDSSKFDENKFIRACGFEWEDIHGVLVHKEGEI